MESNSPLATPERADELKKLAGDWPSHDLTAEQVGLVELLLTGALAPLRGFMGESECASGKLSDGTSWPRPVTLSVPAALAEKISTDDRIALRDLEGVILAALTVSEIFELEGQPTLAGELEGLALGPEALGGEQAPGLRDGERQRLEVVRTLLRHGADPSIVDNDGDAAADHARKKGHGEVERALRAAAQ